MLETLTIRNFGIIETVALELTPGLNILTGETGAGKSILIDALRFGLGERFQTSSLRDDGSACIVEAVFHLTPTLLKTLESLDAFPLEEGRLIIQRSVAADGKNRVKINGLTATVSQLKELGDALIDFHGPHDHQQLLAETRHISIIDTLSGIDDIRGEYDTLYRDLCAIRSRIDALAAMAQSRDRDLELCTHQLQELEQVELDQAAYEATRRDQVKIANAQKLFEHISQALDILENDDAGTSQLLARAFKPLQQLANIDEKASDLLSRLGTIQEENSALVSSLKDYGDSLSFDTDLARRINARYDAYEDVRRKYGPTIADASKFYAETKQKFQLLSDYDHNTAALDAELKDKEAALMKLARAMSQRRKKTADSLKKTIEKELFELGFKSIEFEARFDHKPLAADGTDSIRFFISTNAGEQVKPLAEIVSSGESARIMLAVKRALMKADPVPVLIFDEVDAQIGGRLGTVIGTKLKEIANLRQVILITHLPQIAAFAQTHFRITKSVVKGRTRTDVAPVEGKERLNELAHMMAGDTMTPAALKHAKDMLTQAGTTA